MSGATFIRCAARTLLSVPACKTVKIRGYHRQYWTAFRNITLAITCPDTVEKWQKLACGFQEQCEFLLCLRALDGKHITIRPLPQSGSTFYNYKHNFYIVEMAQGGRTALLLTIPTLSYLGLEASNRVQNATAVHALEKDEEVIEQADYLYSCGETEKLYQLLLKYKDSDDAEFLWRLARASRDLSLLAHITAEEKNKLTFGAFEYAKKALEKNEACFAAHKWFAVCLSDIGDYKGVKVKIGNSYIIKDHLERAIELNPKDATSIHILGYWCFAFAELPWYQRKVAAMIFASPPNATYEEALTFFLKAEEVDPNFYSKNLLMLGKTYMAMKDKEKAVVWLSKAQDYPPHTEEDKQVHKEAIDLLKKLGA